MKNIESTQEVGAIRLFPDGRMDTESAAAYTGVSLKTMAILRTRGNGPVYCKLGKRCYYNKADLDAWINSRRASSTAEYRALRQRAMA